MAKRRRQPEEEPAFPKNPRKVRAKAEPVHNARGFTLAEWKAADYDPEQFETAVAAGEGQPASAIMGDLIEQLRGPERVAIVARILEHPLAPPTKRRPASHDLAHALSYGKESLWFAAAEAVAREVAIDAADQDSDEPVSESDEPPADPLLPAAEAIAQVAEQLGTNIEMEVSGGNGSQPHQATLFVTAKEFNDAGAFDAIAEKQRTVQWAKDRYESAKATASELKKVFDREDAELLSMIGELARRKHERDRQRAEAADRHAEVTAGPESDAEPEAGETSDDAAIASEAGNGEAGEAVL